MQTNTKGKNTDPKKPILIYSQKHQKENPKQETKKYHTKETHKIDVRMELLSKNTWPWGWYGMTHEWHGK